VLTPAKAMTAPALAGPDDPRALDDDRVQRDGVDHALGADQLDDEALARRVVDALTVPRAKTSAQTISGVTEPAA
jgi:hypothetical protein